jgi:hypothetical protein
MFAKQKTKQEANKDHVPNFTPPSCKPEACTEMTGVQIYNKEKINCFTNSKLNCVPWPNHHNVTWQYS